MSRTTQKLQTERLKASAPKVRRPRPDLKLPNKNTAATATASDAIALRDSIIAFTGQTKLNKTSAVVSLLCSEHGATISDIMDATGWQAHSVRGFLSGTVRKKLGLNLISEVTGDGIRRYRIKNSDSADPNIANSELAADNVERRHNLIQIAQVE